MEALRAVLLGKEVGSQEEILQELERCGFSVTQATLSRDLRRIKAVKTTTAAGYKYILPENPHYRRPVSSAVLSMVSNTVGLRSIVFSGNIAVLHTRPGFAPSLASEIDSLDLAELAGTVAGDDTVIAVMTEGTQPASLVEVLSKYFPEVANVANADL